MSDIETFFTKEYAYNDEEKRFFDKCFKLFSEKEVALIKKAFIAAKDLHQGQKRESGEDYIVHPLRVAGILMDEIRLIDSNSVCAALLHDTIEDTGITKEFLSEQFNIEIASLVDGVSKIKDLNLKTKTEEDIKNNAEMLRKILNNPKIILIKLADRLHNMRTLEYKKNPNKQLAKSVETLSFYVPIAKRIGARKIKEELEDLCLKFLSPADYKNISNIIKKHEIRNSKNFEKLLLELKSILENNNINNDIEMKTLNIYGIFDTLKSKIKFKKIPKLNTYKIIVNDKDDCYKVLKLLKENYGIYDLKDYIEIPKITGFRGLSFYIDVFKLIRLEVSTKEMKVINDYGYAGIFNNYVETNENIIENSFFMLALRRMSEKYSDDMAFYESVNKKLLVEQLKIFTPKRKIIWMPVGSTVKDFAYAIHTEIGKSAIGAIVNGIEVDIDYVLNYNDVVEVLTKNKKIKEEPITLKRIK